MIDGWALWLLLVGLAVGAAGATLLFLRLPRADDDLGAAERRTEAAWISATIERHGGIAPESLTEEVLELHRSYLASPRPPAPAGASAPPVPAMAPPGPPAAPPLPPAPPAPPGAALRQPGSGARPPGPGAPPPAPGTPAHGTTAPPSGPGTPRSAGQPPGPPPTNS